MRYAILFMACLVARVASAQASTTERARVALPHDSVTLVEVSYGPGGSSKPHHHDCPVIAYVISGALRSRVGDAPESTYAAGQTFYEPKGSEHRVSANASKEQPVRFLAMFVCDRPR
jgi:quercetin dioxygenase-like cupin family protein